MKVDGYESRLITLFNSESQEIFIIETAAVLEPFYYTPAGLGPSSVIWIPPKWSVNLGTFPKL